jgi:hypothetical protein
MGSRLNGLQLATRGVAGESNGHEIPVTLVPPEETESVEELDQSIGLAAEEQRGEQEEMLQTYG